jgi:polyisoprenoid-binding protein YceI
MSSSMAGTAVTTTFDDVSGHYDIDVMHSRLGFVARHAMVTKVRGFFADFAGTFDLDASHWPGSTAQVTIQVASIDTGNEQRDGHLRTNDFFDAPNFPEITFTSTGVEVLGDARFAVTGDLTIRGVTKPVTIELEYTGAAKDPFGNDRIGFEGQTVINRKDWGVNFNAPLEAGGVLVSEKVTLELDISAVKAA